MLLIEGPDLCGKSTVAEELTRLLPGWSYRHHTKPPVDSMAYFTWFLADAHPRIIVDRLHWSDYAYGEAYAGGMALDAHQWRLTELALMSLGTTVLLMIDDVDAIKGRWHEGEMYKPDQLPALVQNYWDLAKQESRKVTSYLPVITCTLGDLMNLQKNEPTVGMSGLVHREFASLKAVEGLLPPSLGCGNPTPSFMVLGEAPGIKEFKDDLVPHLPFNRGYASEWLWSAFDFVHLRWWEGYYTNASAFVSPGDLGRYVCRLRPRRILCLGNVAAEMVAEAKRWNHIPPHIESHKVDHPSYARRFRNSQFTQYCAEIMAGMGGCCAG